MRVDLLGLFALVQVLEFDLDVSAGLVECVLAPVLWVAFG